MGGWRRTLGMKGIMSMRYHSTDSFTITYKLYLLRKAVQKLQLLADAGVDTAKREIERIDQENTDSEFHKEL